MNLPMAALAFVLLLIGTFDSASSQDCDVTATCTDAASSEQELQDVLLLQMGRHLSTMALHEPLPTEKKVSPDRKTERTVKPWTELPALIALASEVKELSKLHLVRRASSFGGFLLWLIIVALLLGAIGYLVLRYLTTKRRDQTGQSASSGSLGSTLGAGSTMGLSRPSAPATERLLRQEDSAQLGSVPPPILCKQLVLQDYQTRFVVDCSLPLQDPDTNQFEVKSPNTGTVLLEGEIHNNIMLSLHKKGSQIPHVMLRGVNRTQDVKPMLSILDPDGAYFGKVAEATSGTGVVLYHKNRPSCMIKAVEQSSSLEVSASALQNPGGGWVAQSKIDRSSGSVSMNFQARPGVDSTLFLGIFLAMTMIEPKLMQMAMKSELGT